MINKLNLFIIFSNNIIFQCIFLYNRFKLNFLRNNYIKNKKNIMKLFNRIKKIIKYEIEE